MSGYKDLNLVMKALGGLDQSLTQNQALGFNQKNALTQLAMQRKQQELSQANAEDMMRYRREALAMEKMKMRAQAGKMSPMELYQAQTVDKRISDLASLKYKGDYNAAMKDLRDAKAIPNQLWNAHSKLYGDVAQYPEEIPEKEGPGWFERLFGGEKGNTQLPSPQGQMPTPIPSSAYEPRLEMPGLFPVKTDQPLWKGPPVVKSKAGALGGKKPALNAPAQERRTERTLGGG